jgi:hypothetical protein
MSIKFKDILEDILPDIYGDMDEAKRRKNYFVNLDKKLKVTNVLQ